MQLVDLKEYINKLPKTFDHFELMNGEMGFINPEDTSSAVFRLDKPIVSLYVDEKTQEVCFFHQSREDLDEIIKVI